MADPIIGQTAQFQRGDGATPTEGFTEVAQVDSIDVGAGRLNMVDATHNDVANDYMTYIPGLIDPPELRITGFFTSDVTQDNLLTDFQAKTKRNFKLVFPSAFGTLSFTGYITELSYSSPTTGAVKFSCSIKCIQKPTFA